MIESKIHTADTDVVQASFMAVGTFLQQSGAAPDFLKMDIEGGEKFVVPTLGELVRFHRPKLFISVHW